MMCRTGSLRDLRVEAALFFPGMSLNLYTSPQCPANWQGLVYAHLSKSSVEEFIRNITYFIATTVVVELSSGSEYNPLRLGIHEFRPLNPEALILSNVDRFIDEL